MASKETYQRSFLKTFTWRIIASLDTALLTWLFSGNVLTGLKVGGMEIVTKLFIYFFHERAWSWSDWGLEDVAEETSDTD